MKLVDSPVGLTVKAWDEDDNVWMFTDGSVFDPENVLDWMSTEKKFSLGLITEAERVTELREYAERLKEQQMNRDREHFRMLLDRYCQPGETIEQLKQRLDQR